MPKNSKKPGNCRMFSTTWPMPPAATVLTITMTTREQTITIACIKSEALSARKPPISVYASTNTAPRIIIVIYGAPNRVEKSFPQVTRQLAAYTVKKIRMNRAAMVIMTFLFSRKRLEKNSGSVMALLALML